jgi:hypothetical protein
MRQLKISALGLTALTISVFLPNVAHADLFGGDVLVLTQILAESIQQLIQIESVVKNGSDTFSFLQEINSGIRNGLSVMEILNPKFNPGLYGNLNTAESVLSIITNLYGSIPQTSEYRLQQAQDQSVAESIAMNGTLFQFADQADVESHRIFDQSQGVSPQGAGKLTAQSVAVLIGVTTQMLRTNSMMLKMMSEDMALRNRNQKLQSEQFREQYDGLSTAIGKLPSDTTLAPLNQ